MGVKVSARRHGLSVRPAARAALLLFGSSLLVSCLPLTAADEGQVQPALLPSPRFYMSAVWTGTHAYLFGGEQAPDGTDACTLDLPQQCSKSWGWYGLDDVLRYDPATGALSNLSATVRLPTPLSGASAVWDGTGAWIFGGYSAGQWVDTILRFEPSTNQVTTSNARLPSGRSGTAAVWNGQYAYVFGGRVSSTAHTDEIVRFDPATQTTTVMNTRIPTPVGSISAVWVGPDAIVFDAHHVLRYDPQRDEMEADLFSLPTGFKAASAVYDGSSAYLFGGQAYNETAYWGGATFSEIRRFDPSTNRLTLMNVTLPQSARQTSAVWSGTYAYVFGGYFHEEDGRTLSHGDRDTVFRMQPTEHVPTAGFEHSPARPAVGQSIQFTDRTAIRHDWVKSWQWSFGDGGTSTARNPIHAYAQKGRYTVRLRVLDNDSDGSEFNASVAVGLEPPVASFAFSPQNPRVGADVSFTDRSSDVDGAVVSWRWDFDDGSNSTQPNPRHRYDSPGARTVRLSVVDNDGERASVQRTLVVSSDAPNQPPAAAFDFQPSSPTTASAITFLDASTDPEGALSAWSWDFGDGSASSQASPTHTYPVAGTYRVRLIVTDAGGASANVSRDVVVSFSDNTAPLVDFTYTPRPPRPGNDVTFVAEASDPDAGGSVLSLDWSIDGEAAGTGPTLVRRFDAAGSYQVRLRATDDEGAARVVEKRVDVYDLAPLWLRAEPEGRLTIRSGQQATLHLVLENPNTVGVLVDLTAQSHPAGLFLEFPSTTLEVGPGQAAQLPVTFRAPPLVAQATGWMKFRAQPTGAAPTELLIELEIKGMSATTSAQESAKPLRARGESPDLPLVLAVAALAVAAVATWSHRRA